MLKCVNDVTNLQSYVTIELMTEHNFVSLNNLKYFNWRLNNIPMGLYYLK